VHFAIRDFRKDDFETLWRIDQQCFAPGISYSRLELAAYIRLSGSFTLVAEGEAAGECQGAESEIVGRGKGNNSGSVATDGAAPNHQAILGFVVSNANRFGAGHIITIDVIPARQRSGVGSLLLRTAEERLRKSGCRFVRLETAVNNTSALSFYKRHDYFLIRTLSSYYADGSDALVLRKELLSPPLHR